MSEEKTMPPEFAGAKPRRSRLPFILTIMACCAAALSVYLWGSGGGSSPRRVKLGFVTWNNDAFWDPVIRGAEDAAKEWNVDLTAIRSTPETETQSKHVSDLLAKGVE